MRARCALQFREGIQILLHLQLFARTVALPPGANLSFLLQLKGFGVGASPRLALARDWVGFLCLTLFFALQLFFFPFFFFFFFFFLLSLRGERGKDRSWSDQLLRPMSGPGNY
jgi:hypothetical protein